MIQVIFGILILVVGGYTLYLGTSGIASETEGHQQGNAPRIGVIVLGVIIASVGVAMFFVRGGY